MSASLHYDVAIIGAGVSGLCLALALLDAGGPWTILLVEGGRDEGEFRALSFWSDAPTPLDDLVRHRWQRLVVADDRGGTRTVALRDHHYQTLFLADLRRAVTWRLRDDPRHRVVHGTVSSLDEGGDEVKLAVADETLHARWAFDSRFRRDAFTIDPRRETLLWQRFHGLVVRSATDAFDPSTAIFLDFRVEAPAGLAFVYLLPFSPREALVELVTVGPIDDPEGALRRYLATAHGAGSLEVVAREAGASPLTDHDFGYADGPRVRRLGVAAGRLKPSTGYALARILDDSAAIVLSLQSRGHPMVAPPNRRLYRALDGVFLTLWARWPTRMPGVFAAMFARVPVDRVLRFLDERASPWDLLALVARLPLGPFLAALVAWLMRRRARSGLTGGPRGVYDRSTP